MSDLPPPPQPSGAPPEQRKGLGCFYGGLAFVGSWILGGAAASMLINTLPGTDSFVGAVIGLIPIGLLVAAAIYWRRIPGFLLGIGLSFAIVVVVFTACAALVIYSLSNGI